MDRKLNLMSNASGGNTGFLEELGRQPTVSVRGKQGRGGGAGDDQYTWFVYNLHQVECPVSAGVCLLDSVD